LEHKLQLFAVSLTVFSARDSILAELEEARLYAIEWKQSSGAWQAAMAKAKILGLVIDRREVGDVGAFDGLTDEQLIEKAARLARSLGVAGPRLVEDDLKADVKQ
jgi:hypothetical protein